MQNASTTKLSILDALKNVARLAKEYFWDSEKGFWATVLLLSVILGVVSSILLTVVLTYYMTSFFSSLTLMNLPLFIESIEMLLIIFAGLSAIKYCTSYLSGVLAADWREWLTNKILNQYSRDKQYLKLNRENNEIKSVDVTAVDSIKNFVELTIALGKDLLEKTLALPIYLRTLWIVGGGLTIVIIGASITIPGYLVFASILFAILASVVSHFIGRALKKWFNDNINHEAKVRGEIIFVNDNAESIALVDTMHIHQESLQLESHIIRDNSYHISQVKAGINAFNEFYQPVASLFPYAVAAPLYFARQISEGDVYNIGYAFSQVQSSLNWFINSYEHLSKYTVSVERIVELEKAMQLKYQRNGEDIVMCHSDQRELHIDNLHIAKTHLSSTEYIVRNLNLKINLQKNTFIRGESGVGKSTIFKVLAGTWKYGQGNILIPEQHKVCVLPQTPVIPPNYTLKKLLDYTDCIESHTQQEYEDVLRETGLGELVDDLHNTNKDWSRTLSGGQKQTIAFARILLKHEKPDLILLDEATSAMDEERQTLMYTLIMRLEHTKMISIAHRSSVMKFHDEVIDLSIDADKNITSKYSVI